MGEPTFWDNPEAALRQLMKCDKHDGDWYYMQGKVLMALEQYNMLTTRPLPQLNRKGGDDSAPLV